MKKVLFTLVLTSCLGFCSLSTASETASTPSAVQAVEVPQVQPYLPRFGRTRPIVAIVGENEGTELTDFVIPYGVLARADIADVVAVGTHPGRLQMTPATVQIEAQASLGQFDARFPEGADYVIVPKVSNSKDPLLLGWITAQNKKGATVVSICDGALVVANTGLMNGRRATAHWATEEMRKKDFPSVKWVKNVRYVGDGNIVSSAGISAAMPTSLALVEAIAGHDAATKLAAQLGVADWSTNHNSDKFQLSFGNNRDLLTHLNSGKSMFRRNPGIGVEIAPGVDEISMALILDAYSRTGRSLGYSLAASPQPVRSQNGLTIYPERWQGNTDGVDLVLPSFGTTPPALVFNKLLVDITQRYGATTAAGVALVFEYPMTGGDH